MYSSHSLNCGTSAEKSGGSGVFVCTALCQWNSGTNVFFRPFLGCASCLRHEGLGWGSQHSEEHSKEGVLLASRGFSPRLIQTVGLKILIRAFSSKKDVGKVR